MRLDTPYLEESDKYLQTYQLPEQVEKLLEMGKYENVENRVTKDNYRRRMHNLLYLEEYKRRECMSRYKQMMYMQSGTFSLLYALVGVASMVLIKEASSF